MLYVIKWDGLVMPRKKIGVCAVDSGQLVITDPAYIQSQSIFKNYENILELMERDNFRKKYHQLNFDSYPDDPYPESRNNAGAGVRFDTGGDGVYPVFANFDRDGDITSVEIIFKGRVRR